MLLTVTILCAIVTVTFTVYGAFSSSKHGGQSMRESMLEAWTNIAIRFPVNYAANLLVLPIAGHPITYGNAFQIGVIFTAISVMMQFFIRRWYNWRLIKTEI